MLNKPLRGLRQPGQVTPLSIPIRAIFICRPIDPAVQHNDERGLKLRFGPDEAPLLAQSGVRLLGRLVSHHNSMIPDADVGGMDPTQRGAMRVPSAADDVADTKPSLNEHRAGRRVGRRSADDAARADRRALATSS